MQTENDNIWNRELEKYINKDNWNYCHYFPIFPLLGVNNHLPLFHMYKIFIYCHNI